MTELTFDLGMLTGACPGGSAQAKELFNPDEKYTLKEILRREPDLVNLLWLLLKMWDADDKIMILCRNWVNLCASDLGMRKFSIRTRHDFENAVRAVLKNWVRRMGTREGIENWAMPHFLKAVSLSGV